MNDDPGRDHLGGTDARQADAPGAMLAPGDRGHPGPLAAVDPVEVRAALAAVGARVSSLVRSVVHPDAPALGIWSTTDVAVHLSHAVDIVTALARGSDAMAAQIWDLSKLTTMLVAGEVERDLGAIATRIDASVAGLLAVLREAGDSDPPRRWLIEGIELPLSSIGCHALNELVVHGSDIARADGAPLPVERLHASLVLRGFLLPVMGALGRSLVDQDRAARARVTYRIHLRGGGSAYLRFQDGDLTVSVTAPGPVDCHLRVDPMAFLMVAWARTSQWPAIARGRLVAYGRKPWLGLKLRGMLRNP